MRQSAFFDTHRTSRAVILPSRGSSQTYPSRSFDGMPYRHYSTLSNNLGCCFIPIGSVATFWARMNSFAEFFLASYNLTSRTGLRR